MLPWNCYPDALTDARKGVNWDAFSWGWDKESGRSQQYLWEYWNIRMDKANNEQVDELYSSLGGKSTFL